MKDADGPISCRGAPPADEVTQRRLKHGPWDYEFPLYVVGVYVGDTETVRWQLDIEYDMPNGALADALEQVAQALREEAEA